MARPGSPVPVPVSAHREKPKQSKVKHLHLTLQKALRARPWAQRQRGHSQDSRVKTWGSASRGGHCVPYPSPDHTESTGQGRTWQPNLLGQEARSPMNTGHHHSPWHVPAPSRRTLAFNAERPAGSATRPLAQQAVRSARLSHGWPQPFFPLLAGNLGPQTHLGLWATKCPLITKRHRTWGTLVPADLCPWPAPTCRCPSRSTHCLNMPGRENPQPGRLG